MQAGRFERPSHQTTRSWKWLTPNRRYQDRISYNWIRDAEKNQLVVGTQGSVLCRNCMGRVCVALKFNELVRETGMALSW